MRTLPYRTVHNVIDGVVITFEDITRQTQTQNALKQSEEMLRMIIESGEDVISLIDFEGRYLHYSGPKSFGLSPETVMGQSIFDVLESQTAKKVLKEIKDVFRTNQGHYYETHFPWKGKVLYYEDFRYPVKDNNGDIFAVGTIGRNITKRKNVELLLQQCENCFETALKESPIIVAHIDCDLRYTWVHNPHPEFDPFGLISKRDDEIVKSEATLQLMQMKKQVIETGKGKRKTIRFAVSGTTRKYDIAIQPIVNKSGEIIGATSASFDITKQVTEDTIQ